MVCVQGLMTVAQIAADAEVSEENLPHTDFERAPIINTIPKD